MGGGGGGGICFAYFLLTVLYISSTPYYSDFAGGRVVLGKLPVLGRPTIWITVGQGPTALAVGAGGGCLDIFTLICPFSLLSPSLWETAQYRLKYCLKGPLNPKQPTNQYSDFTNIDGNTNNLNLISDSAINFDLTSVKIMSPVSCQYSPMDFSL